MAEFPYEQELDANDARIDFENVLQGMLDKANAGESFTADSISAGIDSVDGSQEDVKKLPSTPTKSSRKRRRKEEIKDDKQKSNSYVMKLFDRSIDLALFSEETPLYPICRAWMNNDPGGKKVHSSVSLTFEEEGSNSEEEDNTRNVTDIPPPNINWNNIDSRGRYVNPRVPNPLPLPEDRIDDYLIGQASSPLPETLLLNHIQRWRNIRERWIQKSNENDERYADGMTALRDMFNRQLYSATSQ